MWIPSFRKHFHDGFECRLILLDERFRIFVLRRSNRNGTQITVRWKQLLVFFLIHRESPRVKQNVGRVFFCPFNATMYIVNRIPDAAQRDFPRAPYHDRMKIGVQIPACLVKHHLSPFVHQAAQHIPHQRRLSGILAAFNRNDFHCFTP